MGFILVAFQENVERIKAERGGKKTELRDDTRKQAGEVRVDVNKNQVAQAAPAPQKDQGNIGASAAVIAAAAEAAPVGVTVVAPAVSPAPAPTAVAAVAPAAAAKPEKLAATPTPAPAATLTPTPVAPAVQKEVPKQKSEPTIGERTAEIANKTATVMHQAKDRTDLIRTAYALGVIDGEFKDMTVEAVIQKFGKRIGGTHYSDEVLIKAANQPGKKLPEFESLLAELILQQKLTKKGGKYVMAKEGGGVIVTIPDGDPTFAFHEARHAESAHYHFRENPEALKKAEAIVQKQGKEWKAKAIGFFLGTPYWEAMGKPNGFNVPADINQGASSDEIKGKKLAKAEEYLKLSGDKIVFPKDMQKKAWILDEFVSYASDMNEQSITDVPEFADFFEKTAPGKK